MKKVYGWNLTPKERFVNGKDGELKVMECMGCTLLLHEGVTHTREECEATYKAWCENGARSVCDIIRKQEAEEALRVRVIHYKKAPQED